MPVPFQRSESNIAQVPPKDLLPSVPDEVLDALLWECLLVAVLASLAAPGNGYKPCKVATTADDLPDAHKPAYWKLVNTSFADGGLSAHETCARLAKGGIFVGTATIDRHRKGTCRCPRK